MSNPFNPFLKKLPFNFQDIPALDIETTGLHSEFDQIIQASFVDREAFEINVLEHNTGNKLSRFAKQTFRRMGATGVSPATTRLTELSAKQRKIFSSRGFLTDVERYRQVTLEKEKARRLIKFKLNQIVSKTNNPIIIHNANFERNFLKASGINLPMEGQYFDILENASKELSLINKDYLSHLSRALPGQHEAITQTFLDKRFKAQLNSALEKYDYFVDVLKNRRKAVIDTQAAATAAIGLLQEKGFIPRTGDIFTGSSLEFLGKTITPGNRVKELHLAAADAWLSKQVAPEIFDLVDKLRAGNSDFTPSQQRFINELKTKQLSLKLNAVERQFRTGLEKINRFGEAEFERGSRIIKSKSELVDYFSNKGSKFFHGTSYSKVYKGFNPQVAIDDIVGKELKTAKQVTKLTSNKGAAVLSKTPSKIIPAAGVALLSGAFLYNLFSGKDDNYNTIEGLRHGWFGNQRSQNTDFGSGYKVPEIDIDNYSKVQDFAEQLQDPEFKAEIKADIKEKQAEALAKLGAFKKSDLMRINDLSTLEAINSKRKAMREVKLREYEILVDDADTLVLNPRGVFGGKPIEIRMAGIDAPETKHANDPIANYRINQEQPGGGKATARLKEIIENSENLRLFVDPSQKTYGRYLGVLFNDTRNIHLQLVQEGLVSSLEFGSQRKDLVDRSVFSSEGKIAEQSQIGIWGDPFYQDWLAFSKGLGRDLTFNSLTDIVRLAENQALGLAAGLAWGEGEASDLSFELGKLYSNKGFKFSDFISQKNTIEALRHGWFGSQRRENTDFGSGFRVEEFHKGATKDPTPDNFIPFAATAGVFALGRSVWNKPFNYFGDHIPMSSLSYLGLGGHLTDLGRDKATYGDIVYNAIKRIEYGFGGIPKTFSISAMMSPYILRDATYKVSIGEAPEYAKYLDHLTGRQLVREGYSDLVFNKGKLYGIKGNTQQLILDNARLVQRVHDANISQAPSQFAESLVRMRDIPGSIRKGVPVSPSTADFPFLITGGTSKARANMDMLHAFAHESLSKYLRLLDDPAKFTKDLFSMNPNTKLIGEGLLKFVPKLGVGGEANLVGSVPTLLKRHAATFLPKALLLPFAFGVANWTVKGISPEGTVGDQAGLLGIGAEAIKTGHLTAARVSEYTGLTDLRQSVEEQAPGSTGVMPWLGLSFSGAMTGAFLGVGQNLFEEVLSTNKYETLIKNIGEANRQYMPQMLRGVPGFKSEYTRAGRYARFGALTGAFLGLPFLIAGIGSDKSVQQLEAEYSGELEVPIYKGRWWELGQTPFKGENIAYYRPNWYQRLLSNYKEKSIYGEENLSPFTKLYKDFTDPYWLEKMHYEDRPYPVTGSSGEHLGIFGPLYEWTIGRLLKPPLLMHTDKYGGGPVAPELGLEPSAELGGLAGPTPISPYGAQQQIQQQWYSAHEALGLRGFAASIAVKALKGEGEFFTDKPILQSAADIESPRRDFWDLNLGGGFGMSEPLRRIIPRRTSEFEYVNPIANQMPDWLPGEDYFINFRQGDIYSRISEGEYRLPGVGYAARYRELEDISPEDYPLEHRYKILADVAMYSREFSETQQRMQTLYRENKLSDEAALIFEQTEEQVKLKKKKKEFREETDSLLGKYYAALIDTIRLNPLEHLTPISPAHKLAPPLDPLNSYREMVYTREFKSWQHPYEHFVKPTVQLTGHLLGWEGIPDDVEQRREVEDYFDKLQYIKSQKLKELARERKDSDLYRKARDMETGTIAGVNPYTYPSRVVRALPDRERPYFLEFVDATPEEKQQILTLAPDNMRDIYLAQWDNKTMQDIREGKIQGSKEELEAVQQHIKQRRELLRLRRKAEMQEFENSEYLPPDDWIGWRTDVDLEDVKLKYVLNQGEDYHFYNLWENRLRLIGRKPYLDDAVQYVRIPRGKTNYQNLYDFAAEAGISEAEIQISTGLIDNLQIDIDQDRTPELDKYLRTGGLIL